MKRSALVRSGLSTANLRRLLWQRFGQLSDVVRDYRTRLSNLVDQSVQRLTPPATLVRGRRYLPLALETLEDRLALTAQVTISAPDPDAY